MEVEERPRRPNPSRQDFSTPRERTSHARGAVPGTMGPTASAPEAECGASLASDSSRQASDRGLDARERTLPAEDTHDLEQVGASPHAGESQSKRLEERGDLETAPGEPCLGGGAQSDGGSSVSRLADAATRVARRGRRLGPRVFARRPPLPARSARPRRRRRVRDAGRELGVQPDALLLLGHDRAGTSPGGARALPRSQPGLDHERRAALGDALDASRCGCTRPPSTGTSRDRRSRPPC